MKKELSYLLLGMLCIMSLLTACESNEPTPQQQQRVLTFECLYPSTVTRATESGFEAKDRVGVFLTSTGQKLSMADNIYSNIPITYNGANWDAGFTFYWNDGIYDAYAYYPYMKTDASYTDYPFNVNTDQSTVENYMVSDFLWAKTSGVTASNEPVKLEFKHLMSKLLINVKKSNGQLPDDAVVYVHSTITRSTVDLNTGTVSKQSQQDAESIRARNLGNGTYAAFIIPQRLDDTIVPLVEIIANGTAYIYDTRFIFKAGVCHTLTLKIN